MIYPRLSNTESKGSILVDVLMALGLSTIFVSGITAASIEARDIFDKAGIRSVLMDAFVAHKDDFSLMMPGQVMSQSYTVGTSAEMVLFSVVAKWYGNDRIETDFVLHGLGQSLSFVAVRKYPYKDISEAVGLPLCSPDLASGDVVGSYRYLQNDKKTLLASQISVTPIILPIDPLLPLTDMEVRGGIAYVSTDSSVASDPDLLVIDISDPKHPHILSSIDTGPGISSIALAGDYVFAAAASTAAQLHVIRINSLTSLVLTKKYKLPPPMASTSMPKGSAIAYDRGMVYLGTEKWDGNELSVIDVSQPSVPKVIGGLEIGSKVNDIAIRNGVALVASASINQLQRVDVNVPAHPLLLSSFSPSGSDRQEGRVLDTFEDSSALGRTSGGFDIVADHEAFFWPNGASPAPSVNIPGGVYGLVADRNHLYMATRNVNKEFAVFDHILSTSTAVSVPLPVAPQAMTCDIDSLYLLAHGAPAIYEIKMH